MLVFELIIFLLIVLAIAEVVCLILLYHRIFYQKKQSIDIFFICVFFIGFVCTLQFLSLLHIYESIKVNPKHEIAPLFTIVSTNPSPAPNPTQAKNMVIPISLNIKLALGVV